MRQLFPPWSDTVFRLCLVLAVLGIASIPIAMVLWVRTPYVTKEHDPVEQPLQFDHRHHVRDDGIDCMYCHSNASKSAYAGAPPTALCLNCHAQIWQTSSYLAPVRRSWFENEPIRWQRVHQLPQFVYFNHSAHVDRGVGCVECHGRVDLMGQVHAVAPLTMIWCLRCHRDPAEHLRPQTEITNMEWSPERPRREIGEQIIQERHIDPPVNYCTGCHR